jgi:penicillin-binding protein 2
LAALEAHVLDPDRVYDSPGYYLLGKGPRARRIGDTANGGQPDRFDFKKGLAQSSNAYFIHYGLLAGPDAIVDMARRFHFGELTGIPLGQEVRGLVPTREWQARHMPGGWFDGDTANLSIGQGKILVTPLQVALMTAAVANGGTLFWPRLVARVDAPAGGDPGLQRVFPAGQVRDQVRLSRATLRVVHDAMLADVESDFGTGRRAAVPGLKICAKTGTAQVEERGKVVDHTTWFTSMAPYGQPRWVVTVMVESGISGGESCAPAAQKIYEALKQRYLEPGKGAVQLAARE